MAKRKRPEPRLLFVWDPVLGVWSSDQVDQVERVFGEVDRGYWARMSEAARLDYQRCVPFGVALQLAQLRGAVVYRPWAAGEGCGARLCPGLLAMPVRGGRWSSHVPGCVCVGDSASCVGPGESARVVAVGRRCARLVVRAWRGSWRCLG